MGMLGDGELTARSRAQNVTVSGWNRQPAFCIQTERRSPLKHPKSPFFCWTAQKTCLKALSTTKLHFFALYQQTTRKQECL